MTKVISYIPESIDELIAEPSVLHVIKAKMAVEKKEVMCEKQH